MQWMATHQLKGLQAKYIPSQIIQIPTQYRKGFLIKSLIKMVVQNKGPMKLLKVRKKYVTRFVKEEEQLLVWKMQNLLVEKLVRTLFQ